MMMTIMIIHNALCHLLKLDTCMYRSLLCHWYCHSILTVRSPWLLSDSDGCLVGLHRYNVSI